jgi:hypothetical protein
MDFVTKDLLKGISNKEEIQRYVKSGHYTFLTTPEGAFDSDSMELAQDSKELKIMRGHRARAVRRSIRDDIHERVMRLIRSECSDCLAAPQEGAARNACTFQVPRPDHLFSPNQLEEPLRLGWAICSLLTKPL